MHLGRTNLYVCRQPGIPQRGAAKGIRRTIFESKVRIQPRIRPPQSSLVLGYSPSGSRLRTKYHRKAGTRSIDGFRRSGVLDDARLGLL